MSLNPTTRGVVFIHSAPAALCPHVEWAIAGVLGGDVSLEWTPQPAQTASYRAELSWQGAPGTASTLASAMRGWEHVRYEITEEASPGFEGERYMYTPSLGIFHAVMGHARRHPGARGPHPAGHVGRRGGKASLPEALDQLLGRPWDDELETFRYAGDGAPVRWLHQVI